MKRLSTHRKCLRKRGRDGPRLHCAKERQPASLSVRRLLRCAGLPNQWDGLRPLPGSVQRASGRNPASHLHRISGQQTRGQACFRTTEWMQLDCVFHSEASRNSVWAKNTGVMGDANGQVYGYVKL